LERLLHPWTLTAKDIRRREHNRHLIKRGFVVITNLSLLLVPKRIAAWMTNVATMAPGLCDGLILEEPILLILKHVSNIYLRHPHFLK
jgi:hypothetical protein